MHLEIVPCLADNYAYILLSPCGDAAIVDPAEFAPVRDALRRLQARPVAIWNTHHHGDHTGGNESLVNEYPGIAVVGHARDRGRIPGQTQGVEDGDELVCGSLRARVISTPGHTLGSVCYEVEGCVFTGDTLFSAGCGRMFEGDPAGMFASLQRIGALPGETRVYPGHEYTLRNLEFAASVAPGNAAVRAALERVRGVRALGRPSIPSTIAEELGYNLFLRAPDAETFAELRGRKDRF